MFEEFWGPEETAKEIAKSNRPFVDNRSVKERDAYAQWQRDNRQYRDEYKEYQDMKTVLGKDMPYKTIGGFRRARRAESDGYKRAKLDVRSHISEKGKRKEVTEIDHVVLNSPLYREKFKGVGISGQAFPEVVRATKKAVKDSKGGAMETAIVIDQKTGKKLLDAQAGISGGRIALGKIADMPKDSVVLTHNHPHSGSFSGDDLALLINVPAIKTMIAAGHDGTIYAISIDNGERIDYTKAMQEYKKLYEANGNSEHEALKSLSDEYGWRYTIK